MNIFLPSLPSISEHFNADKKIVQLTITLYLFATAFLQPILGPLSDYYGRRPIVLFGLIGFFVGTVICIFAPNIETLLIGRIVQATSAAGMVISRAIIRDIVGREKAASMIGYVTMGMAIAPMIGPTMGGYLDEFFGWQATFWLLLVFSVIVLYITWADLGETRKIAAAQSYQSVHFLSDFIALKTVLGLFTDRRCIRRYILFDSGWWTLRGNPVFRIVTQSVWHVFCDYFYWLYVWKLPVWANTQNASALLASVDIRQM